MIKIPSFVRAFKYSDFYLPNELWLMIDDILKKSFTKKVIKMTEILKFPKMVYHDQRLKNFILEYDSDDYYGPNWIICNEELAIEFIILCNGGGWYLYPPIVYNISPVKNETLLMTKYNGIEDILNFN